MAEENVNFSDNNDVGGFCSNLGSTWTIGAMVSQTAGIPLSGPVDGNDYGNYTAFLPGADTLMDILHENGYYQALMLGSEAAFAGRDLYYSQHGTDIIYDYNSAQKDEIIDGDYYVWWGMEDAYLYEYAKQKLTEISQSEKPFAFSMLTADTHHIAGYYCKYCQDTYEEQYENVISCASRQLDEFVSWLRQQDFYKDTTIVIVGDHCSMDNEYISKKISPDYTRHVYNCIINSCAETENSKNRKFSTFDMFPTTLAAMGCQIDGDKLGLGTNMFSDQETLAEKYGYEQLDEELGKRSNYYYKNLLLSY